jgi:lysozyme family protein
MNFPALKSEYEALFASCVILPDHQGHPISHAEVVEFATTLLREEARYQAVQARIAVPWFVIGLIHGMECDFSFSAHLHNGDSLARRTVHVPAGRPISGSPPFAWADSAEDALRCDSFTSWTDWSVGGICFKLEAYNGFGSREKGINTPYLWSGSKYYSKGKYVADDVWDPDAVSKEVGAAVALKYLVDQKAIKL